MRLARILLEGLLVAFLAALVIYVFRDHLVLGLTAGAVVCLAGIGCISLLKRKPTRRKEKRPARSLVASMPDPVQLRKECEATSSAIYRFLKKHANAVTDQESQNEFIAEYRQKFDARVINLFIDLRASGVGTKQLAPSSAPPTSLEDIQWIARALAVVAEEREPVPEPDRAKFQAWGKTLHCSGGISPCVAEYQLEVSGEKRRLRLTIRNIEGIRPLYCLVVDPGQVSTRARAPLPGRFRRALQFGRRDSPRALTFRYPDCFREAPAVRDGLYAVSWIGEARYLRLDYMTVTGNQLDYLVKGQADG